MTRCSMALSAPLSLFYNPPNLKSGNSDSPESFNWSQVPWAMCNQASKKVQLKGKNKGKSKKIRAIDMQSCIQLLKTEHCTRRPNFYEALRSDPAFRAQSCKEPAEHKGNVIWFVLSMCVLGARRPKRRGSGTSNWGNHLEMQGVEKQWEVYVYRGTDLWTEWFNV